MVQPVQRQPYLCSVAILAPECLYEALSPFLIVELRRHPGIIRGAVREKGIIISEHIRCDAAPLLDRFSHPIVIQVSSPHIPTDIDLRGPGTAKNVIIARKVGPPGVRNPKTQPKTNILAPDRLTIIVSAMHGDGAPQCF